MFTGIIEGLGKLNALSSCNMGKKILIKSDFALKDLCVGDSMAVNGACLTITDIKGKYFKAYISPETLSKTNLKMLKVGNIVNLERALKFSDRLNGHLVLGHVDGIGFLKKKMNVGHSTIMTFSVSKLISKYILVKGSIAIEGISLTVNECQEEVFSVSIIPHTLEVTTLNIKKLGDGVNIETDIMGKYIERFMPSYEHLAKS